MSAKGVSSTADLSNEIGAFRAARSSLILATRGEAAPAPSYAPFVEHQGAFYVFVSALASHTAQLRSEAPVGVLFIEDEGDARNPFARRRLSYTCDVAAVARDSAEGASALAAFRARFGAIVDTLCELPDFELFRLTPSEGRYVKGFGQAWRILGERIEHLGPPST